MINSKLIGKQVLLTISDPWNTSQECGTGPFYGQITDTEEEKLLIRLATPIKCNDVSYLSARCQIRHLSYSVGNLLTQPRLPVPINLILLLNDVQILSYLKNADFVGNLTAIGAVELA